MSFFSTLGEKSWFQYLKWIEWSYNFLSLYSWVWRRRMQSFMQIDWVNLEFAPFKKSLSFEAAFSWSCGCERVRPGRPLLGMIAESVFFALSVLKGIKSEATGLRYEIYEIHLIANTGPAEHRPRLGSGSAGRPVTRRPISGAAEGHEINYYSK